MTPTDNLELVRGKVESGYNFKVFDGETRFTASNLVINFHRWIFDGKKSKAPPPAQA